MGFCGVVHVPLYATLVITPPPPLPPLRHAKALGDWLNALRDFVAGQSPMQSQGIRTSRTAVGTFRQAIPNDPIGITQFRIKDWLAPDYLICRPWNGRVEGSNDVYVAKSYYLRADVFDGVEIEIEVESLDESEVLQTETRTLDFLYYSSTFRKVRDITDDPTITEETQTIIPRYLEDDVILAAPSTELTVTRDLGGGQFQALTWVDLNCDARAWMKSS